MPLIRTDQIIAELFTRHRGAIFARQQRGRLTVGLEGPYTDQLGLSLQLEHRLHEGNAPDLIPAKPDASSEAAWRAGQLDLLTTDELLARLQHRPGPWVLGLSRRTEDGKGTTTEIAWRGDEITCAGLTGRLAWLVARSVMRRRLRAPELSSDPAAVAAELLTMIQQRVDHGCGWIAFTAGFPRLLEHALWAALEAEK